MKKTISTISKIILLFQFSHVILFSQIDTYSDKWIRVGSLQSFFSEYGSERAWNPYEGRYLGLQWPAAYPDQDNFVIKRRFLTCKNFTDENSTLSEYASVYFIAGSNDLVTIKHKLIGRNYD